MGIPQRTTHVTVSRSAEFTQQRLRGNLEDIFVNGAGISATATERRTRWGMVGFVYVFAAFTYGPTPTHGLVHRYGWDLARCILLAWWNTQTPNFKANASAARLVRGVITREVAFSDSLAGLRRHGEVCPANICGLEFIIGKDRGDGTYTDHFHG
jgi:hypothetical protein